jgi:1-deoxy-D-xylulose-5-phosphate synthase
VRYPRGTGPGAAIETTLESLPIGKGIVRRTCSDQTSNQRICIFAFGSVVTAASQVAETLDATLADMRFVKPIDRELIRELAQSHDYLVTVEENVVMGGAGSAVAEVLAELGITLPMLHLGLPDRFVEHGDPAVLLARCGLDVDGILASIKIFLPE